MTQLRTRHYLTRTATSLHPGQVGTAYNYPAGLTGQGFTCGIIELGGGYRESDLEAFFGASGLAAPNVVAVGVDGASNSPGQDADIEVLLDIQVAGAIAPAANYRVYFAPNTDQGFLHAIEQAQRDGCHVISISWGAAETEWTANAMVAFDQAFAACRAAGTLVFAAAGDTGADDGTGAPVTDFPASSPHVIACGGTRLELNTKGGRSSEVTWDDNDVSSATGGGLSRVYPGRAVPDLAGNADPQTGYEIYANDAWVEVGGTSAVAPLYAGLALLLCEALGGSVGLRADLLATILANPSVVYDVTVGDNGAYRAGPGRDQVTGFGVVDGTRLLAAIRAPQVPVSQPTMTFAPDQLQALTEWAKEPHHYHLATVAARAWQAAGGTP